MNPSVAAQLPNTAAATSPARIFGAPPIDEVHEGEYEEISGHQEVECSWSEYNLEKEWTQTWEQCDRSSDDLGC